MQLNNLKYTKGSRNHKQKVAGRGFGSNSIRAFKGNKGQGQRNTGVVRAGFEGGQTPIYRRTKKIGFNNYEFSNNYNVITIAQINQWNLTNIDKTTLAPYLKDKKLPIKIIGNDKPKNKLTIADDIKVSIGVKKVINNI